MTSVVHAPFLRVGQVYCSGGATHPCPCFFPGAKWEIAVLAQQWRDHDLIEVCQIADHAEEACQGGTIGANKRTPL